MTSGGDIIIDELLAYDSPCYSGHVRLAEMNGADPALGRAWGAGYRSCVRIAESFFKNGRSQKVIGPRIQPIKTTCAGCPALATEYWRDYHDNDETDSGTSAHCKQVDRLISAYWSDTMTTPDWCPAAEEGIQIDG